MRRRQALNDLEGDIRDHIERETQENIERGLTPEEARRQAMLRFGNVALVIEDTRAVWSWIWLEQILQDVRYCLHTLRGNPGFVAVVVLTLALGVGMNAAVFSVFNAVLLRSVSYPDADRLVYVSLHGDIPFNAIPLAEFRTWREQATSFEGMVAYENTQDHTLQTTDNGTQVRNVWVSSDFWVLSGARPALGRLPATDEGDVVVLSHGFFERWFHGDPSVIGRAVTVNGRQVIIAGALPADFQFQFPQEALGPVLEPKLVDIYRPYGPQGGSRSRPTGGDAQPDEDVRRGIPVRVVAKLQQGFTIDAARVELEAIRMRLAQTRPDPQLDQATLRLIPLHEKLVSETRPPSGFCSWPSFSCC